MLGTAALTHMTSGYPLETLNLWGVNRMLDASTDQAAIPP